MTSETPSVAVITVNYSSESVLPSFLDSIAAASAHPLLVAIADNASSPEVEEMARTRGVEGSERGRVNGGAGVLERADDGAVRIAVRAEHDGGASREGRPREQAPVDRCGRGQAAHQSTSPRSAGGT